MDVKGQGHDWLVYTQKKALVPIVAPSPVRMGLEKRNSFAFAAFRVPPPPQIKILNVIQTLCRMYGQNFDVVLRIGRNAWKIQYKLESNYKFGI